MFYYAENIASQTLQTGILPWEFKQTEEITEQIRKVKEDRQQWYANEATRHYFYTGIEPYNPNMRVNKENNPPLFIHAFVADYDAPVEDRRIDELIADMPVRPSWVERSLGGNFRLVFPLETKIRIGQHALCCIVLEHARKMLKLDMLPELDEQAWENPTRLYCNGCVWRAVPGARPVRESRTQSLLVRAAQDFHFKVPDDARSVPLDIVEAELKKKYKFEWPSAFELKSQGPSFWVEGSTSVTSGVIHEGGMYSYAAHAEGDGFYPWSHPALLGAEFCRDYVEQSMSKATADCYWDDKSFFRKLPTGYNVNDRTEFTTYLKCTCGLSAKAESDGSSRIEKALMHVYNHNRIRGAAPFAMRRPGLLRFNGASYLNLYRQNPLEPALGSPTWGGRGEFPFISGVLDTKYDAVSLAYLLTWSQYSYQCAYNWAPEPGLSLVISGAPSSGKTLFSREIFAPLMGGLADAVQFIIGGSQFNSQMFEQPVWVLDDDIVGNMPGMRTRVMALIKKMVSNSEFMCNEKFMKQCMLAWAGRIIITTNLDTVSLRILSALDMTNLDRTMLIMCKPDPFPFPTRPEIRKIVAQELPYFAKFLLEYKVPDCVEKAADTRWGGYAPYHNAELLKLTQQSSGVSAFKELMFEVMAGHFNANPEATEFRETAVRITRLLEGLGVRYKGEQVTRLLETVRLDPTFNCTTDTGLGDIRTWIFQRPEFLAPPAPVTIQPPPSHPEGNPFQKPS